VFEQKQLGLLARTKNFEEVTNFSTIRGKKILKGPPKAHISAPHYFIPRIANTLLAKRVPGSARHRVRKKKRKWKKRKHDSWRRNSDFNRASCGKTKPIKMGARLHCKEVKGGSRKDDAAVMFASKTESETLY